MIASLSNTDLLMACLVLAVGSWVQGNVGFGLAMISAPVLMLFEPRFVPGPLIACSFLVTGTVFLRERHAINLKIALWAMLGCLIGSTTAAVLFSQMSDKIFSLLFGVLVLLAVALSAMGLVLRPNRRTMTLAGLLSGFMGTLSAIGGPPVALAMQQKRGAELRGTISAYFLVSTSIAMTNLTIAGKFHSTDLPLVGALVPGILIGLAVSHFTRGRFDQHSARPVVLGLSALAALAVLARTLMSL